MSTRRGARRRRYQELDGILVLEPGVQATEQGPHTHDALAVERERHTGARRLVRSRADQDDLSIARNVGRRAGDHVGRKDRKSTRLNSSHLVISYAVFCLKKKKIELSVSAPMTRKV